MLLMIAILLFPLLYLLGAGVTSVLYGAKGKKDLFWEDRILAGIMFLIGLAEGAHLGALASGQSILDFKKYFFVLLLVGTIASVAVLAAGSLILRKKNAQGKASLSEKTAQRSSGKVQGSSGKAQGSPGKPQRAELILLAGFVLLALYQLFGILCQTSVWQERDLTLETVLTFLQSGKLYEINPVTGAPYEMGLPSRLKILCLPTLYAAVSSATNAGAEWVTWHFIPAVVLVLAYLAYYSLGRMLFPGDRTKRSLFLLLAAVLVSVGDYAYGMEGFGLLHCGFQGVTIRGAVLMPYLFGLCMRRKWRLSVLVAAAESCIVWTLYGLGMGVLMILICLACFWGARMLRKRKEGS